MMYNILFILDWLLWIIIAVSTVYILFFALASCLPRRHSTLSNDLPPKHRFLILFPAYKEDAVIIHSVETALNQDYPSELYQVTVISDHMLPITNENLSQLPITLLEPHFENSSKAKALQYAISHQIESFDYVIILDADNVVDTDFLTRINKECTKGFHAIQCHRTAKNDNNGIAVLDGVSEEINNSLFRKGHSRLGLSAGLIGSGMCFDYDWFKNNVFELNSAVEDRELEALLLQQDIFIYYAEDIYVMDEKVSSSDNFQRQRLRWMTGQVQSLFLMIPYLPKAILKGNINYIDKTIQQALIPRSLLLLVTLPISILITLLSFFYAGLLSSAIRWWIIFAIQVISIGISMPPQKRREAIKNIKFVPHLAMLMARNLFKINIMEKKFLHTTHGSTHNE